jgi:gliding motility-associated-like protein
MKRVFTKVFSLVLLTIAGWALGLTAQAQTFTEATATNGTNDRVTALTTDKFGNVWAIVDPSNATTSLLVEYVGGAGSPVQKDSGIPISDASDGATIASLASDSHGNIYLSTNNAGTAAIIYKYTASSSYARSTLVTGSANIGYFEAIAIGPDDNLYAVQYNANGNTAGTGLGDFEIARYSSTAATTNDATHGGFPLYTDLDHGFFAGGASDNYTHIVGMQVDASLNIYVADGFDENVVATSSNGAHIYKLLYPGNSTSSYTLQSTPVASNLRATALAMNTARTNLYASVSLTFNSAYSVVEFTGGTGSPTTLYTGLTAGGVNYPFGLAYISDSELFVGDGFINSSNVNNLDIIFGPSTTQATNVTFSNVASTTATATWIIGNGTSRAVFINQTNTGNAVPVNSTSYTANVNYKSGTQIGGSGWYCVYNGTGTTVNITGLTTGQTYRVMAVEYNGIQGGSDENYLQGAGTNNPNNVTALAGETITFNALTAVTYGNADFSPGATSTNGSVAITYASDNTAVATIVSGNIHIVGQGTAHITASQAGDASHTAAANVIQLLTVNKAALTITANNQTKVYGAALPTLTAGYSGFVNSETSAVLTTQPTLNTTATAASHIAGSPYSITATGAAAANYTISYTAGSLSVTTAPLTVTANNQSKVYGAALPTLTASFTGLVNGDTGSSLTTQPTLITTATAASHVAGSPFSITASGAVDADYTISYVAGSLTVSTAPLTITANNQTKVYGAALPTLTASYTGLVNGDTGGSLSTPPTLTTTATAASTVAGNPYSITASGAVDADYTISYVAGTLTVTTAPLTITANNQTKVYGAALPTLTASITGLVNGDTGSSLTTQPTLSTTATAASHVAGSPYSITASGAVDPNYTISYVAGSLTISGVPLTITADNQSKAYGAAIPTLTASITGFVNGDTGASLTTQPTLTTTATAASTVAGNPYSIMASGAVDADYTISYVAGSLTVTTAPLTIVADNQSIVYGSMIPTLTSHYSGFVNGDGPGIVTTPATLSTTATNVSPAGIYPIMAIGASAGANYTVYYQAGKLTITTSMDATLSNLALGSGSFLPSFNSGTTNYLASVPNSSGSTTIVPTASNANSSIQVRINGGAYTPVSSGSSSSPLVLNIGNNPIDVKEVAQDGTTIKIYTITVNRAATTNTVILSTLTLNPKTELHLVPGPDYRDYAGTVGSSVSSVTVTAKAGTATNTITVNNVTVTSGVASGPIPLNIGDNTITTVVTTQDGTMSNTYSIKLTRIAPAILTTLTTSPKIELHKVAGPDYEDYTGVVNSSVSSVTISPTAADATNTITVNHVVVLSGMASGAIPLNVGDNVITSVVTTADGSTSNTYSIKLTRLTPAILSNFVVSPQTELHTVSGPDYRNNTGNVNYSVSSVTITPTAADATNTITVNHVAVASGMASGAIPLNVGDNIITTVVTTQDGASSNTYTLKLTRLAPAILASLTTNPQEELHTVSGIDYKDLTTIVNYSVTSIMFTPTALDPSNVIKVNNVVVASGTSSAALPLNIGDNIITTVVTTQDGLVSNTYSTKVTRLNTAVLTRLNISPASTLHNAVGPDYKNYTDSVDFTVSSVMIIPTTADASNTITVNNVSVASGTASGAIGLNVGDNIITTIVTSHDGLTSNTYGIRITRLTPPVVASLYDEKLVAVAPPVRNPELVVHQNVSPNGDGKSDVLVIDGITAYPDNTLQIMNRSGALVYETKGYDNTSKVFDGHSNTNGKLQQAGTYFYSLEYKDGANTKRKTGFLVLKY